MMVNPRPVDSFVSTALSKGMSKRELRSLLLKGGWPKQLVDDYMQRTPVQTVAVPSVILKCRGVSKRGPNGPILENIELGIGKGEIFGIVGLGGSGKSTLMHLLVGLLAPDTGDVQFMAGGKTYSVSKDTATKSLIGFSPQVPSLYDDLSASENIMYFGAVYGLSRSMQKSAATTLLRLVGLAAEANHLAAELSLGQRKRLDVACALVHSPKLIALDDPASELDVYQQRELWNLLKNVASKGTTVVIASNFLAELESLCTRIAILRNHRITEIGTPEDLRIVYSHNFEIRLRTRSERYASLVNMLTSAHASQAKKVSKQGNSLIIQSPDPAATLRAILSTLEHEKDEIVSVEVSRPSIQEVFETVSP